MQLAALLGSESTAPAVLDDRASAIEIAGLTADSRAVKAGFLFAALAGTRTDGARFVADAIGRGAVAILAGADAPIAAPAHIPVLRAKEPRRALALMAARFHPRQPGRIVAVTGTNGKTSIAEFTRQIFAHTGRAAASLGTIGIVKPDGSVYGSLTTPDPVTLHATLDALAAEGVTHLAFEASSHGLDQYRLDGVRLAAAAFNNLGRDHLDYHPTIAAYLDAKLRLFRELLQPGQPGIVNADAPMGAAEAIAAARARGLDLMTTGIAGDTLRLVKVERIGFRQRLEIAHGGRVTPVTLPLIGDYQAGNALVALALVMAADGLTAPPIDALAMLKGVSGRLEVTAEYNGGLAVVDYAHKPEALAAALGALRPFATGKLVCIVGCGGDRDKGKRPIMGRIAAEAADAVIVTDDNPRTEVAAAIRAEVMAGVPSTLAGKVREIGDRGDAIRAGIAMLAGGDVLLVAGKGHETGQIVGDTVLPFSDQETISAAVAGGRHV